MVAVETLDMLARETLFSIANKRYAGGAANFEELTLASKPSLTDLRLIVLDMKKSLVKPRTNGAYHVIGSPEFYFDLVTDPIVEKYMTYNQSTYQVYSNTKIPNMFDLEFHETLICPTSGEFVKANTKSKRYYYDNNGSITYVTVADDGTSNIYAGGYVQDSRTGEDASYIPANSKMLDWTDTDADTATTYTGAVEFKAQHILIVGKDALTRTGLSGEGQAKMYVKQKGSSGVLDPIDQRQSIGFKINSVGFGSTRLEAVYDYVCVPSQVNL